MYSYKWAWLTVVELSILLNNIKITYTISAEIQNWTGKSAKF